MNKEVAVGQPVEGEGSKTREYRSSNKLLTNDDDNDATMEMENEIVDDAMMNQGGASLVLKKREVNKDSYDDDDNNDVDEDEEDKGVNALANVVEAAVGRTDRCGNKFSSSSGKDKCYFEVCGEAECSVVEARKRCKAQVRRN